MKEITIPILWAAAESWLGALLWIGLAAGVIALVFYWLAARKHGSLARALAAGCRIALPAGLVAGAIFAALTPMLTMSKWAYVSGAADFVAIALAGLAAAIAVAYFLWPLVALARTRS